MKKKIKVTKDTVLYDIRKNQLVPKDVSTYPSIEEFLKDFQYYSKEGKLEGIRQILKSLFGIHKL